MDKGFNSIDPAAPSAEQIATAQFAAVLPLIHSIPDLENYFNNVGLEAEKEFVVINTPFLEVDFSFTGSIQSKGEHSVTLSVKNGETLSTEFDVFGGLTKLGDETNINMTNPEQYLNQFAASIKEGNIQYEIKTSEDPNEVLEISMNAVFLNIAVITGYDTEVEAELTFKYRNSDEFPNNTLPDCEAIYNLNNASNQESYTDVVYQTLHSLESTFGNVGTEAATIGTGVTAAAALAFILYALIQGAEWAATAL